MLLLPAVILQGAMGCLPDQNPYLTKYLRINSFSHSHMYSIFQYVQIAENQSLQMFKIFPKKGLGSSLQQNTIWGINRNCFAMSFSW